MSIWACLMYTSENQKYLGKFVCTRMWKLSRNPYERLWGSQACYCLVYLPAGQESHAAYISKGILEKYVVKHTFSPDSHLNKAQNLHFPSDHPFIISPLLTFVPLFPSLQSQPLAERLLSLRRQRRAWRWHGNQPLEMYSTTALPTNPRKEAAS